MPARSKFKLSAIAAEEINDACESLEKRWQHFEELSSLPAFKDLIADFDSKALDDIAHIRYELTCKLLETDIQFRQANGVAVSEAAYSEMLVLQDESVLDQFDWDELAANSKVDDQSVVVQQNAGKSPLETQTITFDASNSSAAATASPPTIEPSSQIGHYKLLQQIGEGGMGTVWMAEQEQPVRRRVALKLVKSQLASKEIIARFEAERQALAMMDHPNIARVLDAGTTETGNPYFVMELIKGTQLNEYCDKHELSIRSRLQIMVDICSAIQHAHQKGILHRDLKPSNVLVSEVNGKPVPKVIDFGLAKALEHTTKLTDKTMFTQFGQVVGTLQYMSPEQAVMDSIDIDTRTDIYSLGVLMYEMLAGSTPLDNDTLNKNALLKILELIREKDPPRPSTRLSSIANTSVEISRQRKIAPSKLQQILKGELDWIVMKAIEKDRNRRYGSAAGFAEDIQRFLNSEAVEARPPSANYRFRKFVQKNRGLVAALATIAAFLVTAVCVSSWFAIEANLARNREAAHRVIAENKTREVARERDRANEQERSAKEEARRADEEATKAKAQSENALVAQKIAREEASRAEYEVKTTKNMLNIFTASFDSVDPNTGATFEMSAKDVLLNVLNQLENSDLDDAAKSSMLWSLGASFAGIGEVDYAILAKEKTFSLEKKNLGPEHPNTLRAMTNLAVSYEEAGRFKESLELLEKSLSLYNKIFGPDHVDTLRAMTSLAHGYGTAGRQEEALELREKTLSLATQSLGPEHSVTLAARNNLAKSYAATGRQKEALELQEKTLLLQKRIFGLEHPNTLRSMTNLAAGYSSVGRQKEALELQEKTLPLKMKILGPEHPDTLRARVNLATSYEDFGRQEDALELRKKTLLLINKVLGPEHPHTLIAMRNLASSYDAVGQQQKALKLVEKTLSFSKTTLGPEHPQTLQVMNNLAAKLSNSKIQLSRALELFFTAYSLSLDKTGVGRQTFLTNLGITLDNSLEKSLQLLSLGKHQNAQKLLEAMLKYHGPHSDSVKQVSELKVLAQLGQKDWQGALDSIVSIRTKPIKEGQEDLQKLSPKDVVRLETAQATCLLELDQLEIAKATAEKVLNLKSSSTIDDCRAKIVLAVCAAKSGDSEKAITDAVGAFDELEAAMKDSPVHLRWYLPWMAMRISKVFKIADQDDQAKRWATKSATLEAELIELASIKIDKDVP